MKPATFGSRDEFPPLERVNDDVVSDDVVNEDVVSDDLASDGVVNRGCCKR